MKTLKFRVYIKELKKLIYIGDEPSDTYIMFTENGVWFVYHTFYGSHDLIASSEHDDILMQFTGLQDKNGKDIYEGDIVQWFHVTKGVSVVQFSDGYFHPQGYGNSFLRLGSIEITGNIHENPELNQDA